MQFIPHREHHVFSLEGPVYEGCGKYLLFLVSDLVVYVLIIGP